MLGVESVANTLVLTVYGLLIERDQILSGEELEAGSEGRGRSARNTRCTQQPKSPALLSKA